VLIKDTLLKKPGRFIITQFWCETTIKKQNHTFATYTTKNNAAGCKPMW
jgi:hypothetical protein